MPYLNYTIPNTTKKQPMLFIHIPKTGGDFVERNLSLCVRGEQNLFRFSNKSEVSLHHLTFDTIRNQFLNDIYDGKMEDLFVFTVVRNPYHRILSEMYMHKLINKNSTTDEVFFVIQNLFNAYNGKPCKIKLFVPKPGLKKYTNSHEIHDNHIKPQYKFVSEPDGTLCKNICILHTETLTDDIKNLSFRGERLTEHLNITGIRHSLANRHMQQLSSESIKLINEFYEKDFESFGYEMIKTI